tara:strand:- start:8574 stop:11894 length:3321 start_codon:yes stop_codon:yes gene_type:complete
MANKQSRYNSIPSQINFPQLEEEVLQYWRSNQIFEEVENLRSDSPVFVFYEGPPTANGSPGIHHVLSRSFKDVILRFKTMQGYRPLRRGGWDTHGLPVELEIEKELGLSSKQEIEKYGIEEFNRKCRESVFRYVSEWESMTERVGVWLDMENAYVTYDNSYIETAWEIFKRLWEKELVYEGYKVTPHCPRCVTSLSSHEVALGYKDNTPDPSVFVKFPLSVNQDEKALASTLQNLGFKDSKWSIQKPAFIAWTTTPWTLTANAALAVGPRQNYVLCENKESKELLIVASNLKAKVLGDTWSVILELTGADLVGIQYIPPFDNYKSENHIHRVLPAEYVTTDDGTGIVHTAVAYGADDAELGKAHAIPTLHTVDLKGILQSPFPGHGKFIKIADRDIIKDLSDRELLFKDDSPYLHTYPFCWRCGTPLLYYAKASWYIQTTSKKNEMVKGNQSITWVPDHIKEGRFGEWLRNNIDWSVSRERYWGTPIPIWRCSKNNEHLTVIGSKAELKNKCIDQSTVDFSNLDLHKPFIDQIEINCDQCSATMQRIPEVADAWYDSGAMPFAQWKYPATLNGPGGQPITLNNIDDLISSPFFPANYITEAVDQTRGWFYSLLALSTLVANKPSFESCLVLGLILDGKGEKMSKSKGNVINPWDVVTEHGADALRWYLFTAAPASEARRFSKDLVQETLRQFLLTLWNTYSFFTTYANIDEFDADKYPSFWKTEIGGPDLSNLPPNELDQWIISELNELVKQVTAHLDEINPTAAGRQIQDFVDLLSNWYVRRSRRRFWRSENDEDKIWAYVSLYTCLFTVSKLIAPLAPFVSDAIFHNLAPHSSPKSVHLSNFPTYDEGLINAKLSQAIRLAKRIASLGRSARSKGKIKVRQPLASLLIRPRSEDLELIPLIKNQILEELNIKEISIVEAEDIGDYTVRPNLPVLGPKLGSELNKVRKGIDNITAASIVTELSKHGKITIEGSVLLAEDLLIELEPKDDVITSSEASAEGLLIGIQTSITQNLLNEGFTREIIHRVQTMRKNAGLQIEDRIICTLKSSPPDALDALTNHLDYFKEETLCDLLDLKVDSQTGFVENHLIDNVTIDIGITKVESINL